MWPKSPIGPNVNTWEDLGLQGTHVANGGECRPKLRCVNRLQGNHKVRNVVIPADGSTYTRGVQQTATCAVAFWTSLPQ